MSPKQTENAFSVSKEHIQKKGKTGLKKQLNHSLSHCLSIGHFEITSAATQFEATLSAKPSFWRSVFTHIESRTVHIKYFALRLSLKKRLKGFGNDLFYVGTLAVSESCKYFCGASRDGFISSSTHRQLLWTHTKEDHSRFQQSLQL